MKCFPVDILQFFNTSVKIWLSGDQLGTSNQLQGLKGFP